MRTTEPDYRLVDPGDGQPSTGDEAKKLWRICAPAIAAAPRVRVARDGRTYRRAWEQRLDPNTRPAQPAAVRTYDSTGDTRAVAFDLDCKKEASRAAVLRDCERLTAWLTEAGCAFLVDESPSGGRHVYVLLDHPLSHAELAPLARRLRAGGALPTLDPGPLINLTEGCIRPPGAAYRTGGHQRLVTPLADVERAIAHRTTAAHWAAFRAVLPALPEDRRATDLHAPAAGANTGPKRPLAPLYAQLAVTGRYPADRYPSASEARAAVLLHALCRGWTAADVQEEVRQGRWVGLAGLFESHYGTRYAGKALAADLDRAQARLGEIPLVQRIHTSAARPRGDGGSAARTHIRRWTAAIALAIADGRWTTQRSYGAEMVLTALGDAARRTQTIYPGFGIRHLSMGTGTTLDPSTVAKTLKVLAGETDPLILLIDSDRGLDPDVYELRIPDAYLDRLPADQDLPAAPIGLHPAYAFLPRPAWRVQRVLAAAGEPIDAPEIARRGSVPLRTVHATLKALAIAGLARHRRGGWQTGQRTLTRFARLQGTPTRLRDLVRRWRAERNALRVLHGLEEIRHSPGPVAWPGLPRDNQRPATAAPAGRTPGGELHAADPPGLDWADDVDEPTARLLRDVLGAVPINDRPQSAAS